MTDFKLMIENESVEDVLLYLAPFRAFPDVDRMFVRYKFDVIENAILPTVYRKLLDEGKLVNDAQGHTKKGPHWKEPAFVTQKKYGIS
ncbi:immunity protein [Ewingella sp. S1.OA.A_B6]